MKVPACPMLRYFGSGDDRECYSAIGVAGIQLARLCFGKNLMNLYFVFHCALWIAVAQPKLGSREFIKATASQHSH